MIQKSGNDLGKYRDRTGNRFGKARGGSERKVSLVDHPNTKSLEKVNWESLASDGVSEPVGDGWKSVLRIGDKAAIAVRETPARQVWMGISTQKLASSPEFVILWSNIFDWVGEGGEEFVSQTTGQLEAGWTPLEAQPQDLKPGWWPGIYRRSDGALLAVNAPDIPRPQLKENNWRAQMAELAREYREATRVRWLTTPLLLAAMILLVVAALTWRGGLRGGQLQQRAPKKTCRSTWVRVEYLRSPEETRGLVTCPCRTSPRRAVYKREGGRP